MDKDILMKSHAETKDIIDVARLFLTEDARTLIASLSQDPSETHKKEGLTIKVHPSLSALPDASGVPIYVLREIEKTLIKKKITYPLTIDLSYYDSEFGNTFYQYGKESSFFCVRYCGIKKELLAFLQSVPTQSFEHINIIFNEGPVWDESRRAIQIKKDEATTKKSETGFQQFQKQITTFFKPSANKFSALQQEVSRDMARGYGEGIA